jgi:predicted nucleotidyltransferase component of viral defense system
MGEDSILNEKQQIVLDKLAGSNFITSTFYFGGGTALSEVYLKHRESIDLDFFSETRYDEQEIFSVVTAISQSLNATLESQLQDNTQIYFLNFEEQKLKLDFAYYPYKRLQPGSIYKNLEVDSKLDIAVNKLMLIGSQRTEVKDFVDLYFLLQEFSIWDLIAGVRTKFNVDLEPFTIATDFTAAQDFEFLPRMHKELNLTELKKFFTIKAKELGKNSI